MGGGARAFNCSSEWETAGREIGRGLKVVVGGAASGVDLMGAGVTTVQSNCTRYLVEYTYKFVV